MTTQLFGDLWGRFFELSAEPPSCSSDLAKRIRLAALLMTAEAKTAHVGSCLSVADILAVILLEGARPPDEPIPDLILSKGHAAAAYYSALAQLGLLPMADLQCYCRDGGPLKGHVSKSDTRYAPLSTGSLGHGLPFAVGRAFSAKLRGSPRHTFVILSDGELDEGTTWETFLIANHHSLDNVTVVVDRNNLQSLTTTEKTLSLEPLAEKFRAFGWSVTECSGHDHARLSTAIAEVTGSPHVILANTIKGYGVAEMADRVEWHYRYPDEASIGRMFDEVMRL